MSFQAYLDKVETQTGLTPRQFIALAEEQGHVLVAVEGWGFFGGRVGVVRAGLVVGVVAEIDVDVFFAEAADDVDVEDAAGAGEVFGGLVELLLDEVGVEGSVVEVVGGFDGDVEVGQALEERPELGGDGTGFLEEFA